MLWRPACVRRTAAWLKSQIAHFALAQDSGSVWALSVISMLMDISSEMIHALLPLYLVVGLGASALAVM
jgi:hypothetical protein